MRHTAFLHAGFKYVFIPVDPEMPLIEERFPLRTCTRNDVLFIRHVWNTFGIEAVGTSKADKNRFLLSQMSQISNSNDAKSSQAMFELRNTLNKIEDDHLELTMMLMSLGSVTLATANSNKGARGIQLYHAGSAVKADVVEQELLNHRAMSLCNACNLPPNIIFGDCILAAREEYTEEYDEAASWRRCDFTLADCRSDAQWVLELRKNTRQDTREKSELVDVLKRIPDAPGPKHMQSGACEKYAWNQCDTDVEITFSPGALRSIRARKTDVTVRITATRLYVRLRGRMLMDSELYAEVDPDASYWTMIQTTFDLHITLRKKKIANRWYSVCGVGQSKHMDDVCKEESTTASKLSESSWPKQGNVVELHGLLSEPTLNGQRAEVVVEANHKQRVGVQLQDSVRRLSVQVQNLRAVEVSAATPKEPEALSQEVRSREVPSPEMPAVEVTPSTNIRHSEPPSLPTRRKRHRWVAALGVYYIVGVAGRFLWQTSSGSGAATHIPSHAIRLGPGAQQAIADRHAFHPIASRLHGERIGHAWDSRR